MDLENNVCFYALHIGCLNANDPNCKRCAESLKTAVIGLRTEQTEDLGDYVTQLSELKA
jgi:methylphosphotriester-DNA--protein-cysteine methyltransferase